MARVFPSVIQDLHIRITYCGGIARISYWEHRWLQARRWYQKSIYSPTALATTTLSMTALNASQIRAVPELAQLV